MRRRRAAAVMLAVSFAAAGLILAIPQMTWSDRPTEAAARVTLTEVAAGPVEQTLRVKGQVRGAEEFAALSLTDGIVAEIYVREGEHVQAGQPLMRLDASAAAAAVSRSIGETDRAAGWTTAEQAAQVRQALERQLTQQEDAAAQALATSIIRAPAPGTVQRLLVSRHGGLTTGAPAAAISSEERQILCPVVLRDAAKLKEGMRARVFYGGEQVCGARVEAVAPAVTDGTTGQTVSAVTLTPDTQPDLPMGASVEAEIVLCGVTDAAWVPSGAVTGQGTCWWAADGRAYEIPVTVLLDDGIRCWVDLPVGTQVVLDGSGLIQGQRIREAKR